MPPWSQREERFEAAAGLFRRLCVAESHRGVRGDQHGIDLERPGSASRSAISPISAA
jgi:hypothetical protein